MWVPSSPGWRVAAEASARQQILLLRTCCSSSVTPHPLPSPGRSTCTKLGKWTHAGVPNSPAQPMAQGRRPQGQGPSTSRPITSRPLTLRAPKTSRGKRGDPYQWCEDEKGHLYTVTVITSDTITRVVRDTTNIHLHRRSKIRMAPDTSCRPPCQPPHLRHTRTPSF